LNDSIDEDEEEGDDGDDGGGVAGAGDDAVPGGAAHGAADGNHDAGGNQNAAAADAAADAVPLPVGLAEDLTAAAKKAFKLVDKQNQNAKDITAVFQKVSGAVRRAFPAWPDAEQSKTPICVALAKGLGLQARTAYLEVIPRAEKGARLTVEAKQKRRDRASAMQRVGVLWKKLALVIYNEKNVSLVENKNPEPAAGTPVWQLRGVTPKKKKNRETGEYAQWVYTLRLLRAPPTVEAAATAAAAVAVGAVGVGGGAATVAAVGVGGGAGAVAPVTEKDRERAAIAAARAERISLLAAASALSDPPDFDPEEEPEYMYYVGITSDPPVRMGVHYREQEGGGVEGGGGEGSGTEGDGSGDTFFTSLHPVDCTYRPQFIRVPEGINGRFLEDAVVKDTMALPGVGPERVRGGTYTAQHLSGNSLDLIAQETRHAQELCLNCGQESHMASACSAPRRVQNTARDLGEAKSVLTSVVEALRELKAGTMTQAGVFAVMEENAAALRRLDISGAPPLPPPVI
jgi:hypothetical protein